MKNFILSLLVVAVATGWAHQREVTFDGDIVRIQYEFNEPRKQVADADTASNFLFLDEFSLCDEFGKPGVPQKLESFTLPSGIKVKNVKVTSETVEIPVNYAAAVLPVLESDPTSVCANTITPYEGLWPESAASALENSFNIVVMYENGIPVDSKSVK